MNIRGPLISNGDRPIDYGPNFNFSAFCLKRVLRGHVDPSFVGNSNPLCSEGFSVVNIEGYLCIIPLV